MDARQRNTGELASNHRIFRPFTANCETFHNPRAFDCREQQHEHMLGCEKVNDLGFDMLARRMGARATRRDAIRWLGRGMLVSLGVAWVAQPAAAQTSQGALGDACEQVEGSCQDPYVCFDGVCSESQPQLPATGVGLPDDTSRVAGLGLAAAAVLVAGKLIRDKEHDPEL